MADVTPKQWLTALTYDDNPATAQLAGTVLKQLEFAYRIVPIAQELVSATTNHKFIFADDPRIEDLRYLLHGGPK